MRFLVLAMAMALTSGSEAPTHPDGWPFLGYAHRCTATVGEGDMAITGTLETDLDGGIGMLRAESALHAANPDQIVPKGQKSPISWSHIGSLYWRLSWIYVSPLPKGPDQAFLRDDNGYLYFTLRGERRMPKYIVFATRTKNTMGAELVATGYRDANGDGSVVLQIDDVLNFAAGAEMLPWVVMKSPYSTNHPPMHKRLGHGLLQLDPIRHMLKNRDALEARLLAMHSEREAQCEKVPVFDDNEIMI